MNIFSSNNIRSVNDLQNYKVELTLQARDRQTNQEQPVLKVNANLNIKKELEKRGVSLNQNSQISTELMKKINEVAKEMMQDVLEDAKQKFLSECEHQGLGDETSLFDISHNRRINRKISYVASKHARHIVKSACNSLEKDLKMGLKYAYDRLRLAESQNCHPKDLLSPDEIMEDLLQTIGSEKKELKKQRIKARKQAAIHQPKKRQDKEELSYIPTKHQPIRQTFSQSIPVVPQTSDKSSFIIKLLDFSSRCSMHSRVQRWQTQSIEAIRQFTDKDKDNNVIFHYQNLTDLEIENQRARHFLPGIERLTHSPYKEIYTFPTDRGCGVIAQLFFNKEVFNGIIYLGIDDNKTIFHKYFEDVEFKNNRKNIFLDDKKKANDGLPALYTLYQSVYEKLMTIYEKTVHKVIDLESMISNSNFKLEISDDYVLDFDYSEDYSIHIFPIRTDLISSN